MPSCSGSSSKRGTEKPREIDRAISGIALPLELDRAGRSGRYGESDLEPTSGVPEELAWIASFGQEPEHILHAPRRGELVLSVGK